MRSLSSATRIAHTVDVIGVRDLMFEKRTSRRLRVLLRGVDPSNQRKKQQRDTAEGVPQIVAKIWNGHNSTADVSPLMR